MAIRRRILKVSVILILLCGGAFAWYVNKLFSPANLKSFAVKTISESIDRPIALEGASFSLFRGFSLNNLIIYEPDGKKELLKIGRVSTMPPFIPILTERKIIIPYIDIEHVTLNLEKKQDKSWNFLTPSLFKKSAESQKSPAKGFAFLVQQVKLRKGELNYSDNSRAPAYARQLTDISGNFVVSIKEKRLNFKITSMLNVPSKTMLGIDGSYFLDEDLFTAKAILKNVAATELYEYFYKSALPINLKGGLGDAVIEARLDKNRDLAFNINSMISGLDVAAFDLSLKGDMGIIGSIESKSAEGSTPTYKLVLDMKGASLSGIYFLNELSRLTGKIEISNDAVYTPALTGYAYNTPIEFVGGVDLKTIRLRMDTHANLELSNYKDFLPSQARGLFKDINMQGPAEIKVSFYDNLKDPQPADIDGKIKLKSAALSLPGFDKKFEKISGEILFKNNTYYISRTSFNYGSENYLLDSKIVGLELPDVKMKLTNKSISLTSRFKILKDKIHILRLDGNYFNSSFSAAGNIEKSAEPNLAINGKLNAELTDLRKLFPSFSEPLTRFNIRGPCYLDFTASGPIKNPIALDLSVKGRSPMINFWDIKLTDVKLDLRMKDKRLFIPEFSSKPYGGSVLASMDMDLAQQNPPYSISLSMEEIDLSKLAPDTDLKDKPISGKGLLKANIRGYGKNPETIKGEGAIFIKGGNLWEAPLLKGIADLLFMPNLSSIIFDEVSAHFAVANNAISTSDLKLHSRSIGLLIDGSVFFNGSLDLLVTTSISENFAKSTSEFERLAGALLAEAGRLVGRIKVGGTIKNTEYKFMPFPIDKILGDKVKELLGGFF